MWAASTACLFSQDFIEGHTWETGVSKRGVTVLGVGGGININTPPTPRQGRAIRHTWADVERPQIMSMAEYTGRGRWWRATL